jgi:hypothetical protein
MAQKIEVTITDDTTGEAGAHSVEFAIDGTAYEIDLSEGNHSQLKSLLTPYIDKARKASVKRGPGRPKAAKAVAGSPSGGGSGLTKEERQAVRDFAATHGHPLNTRGRLPELAITAWRQQSAQILSHLAA